MKKLLVFMLSAAMAGCLLTGCGGETTEEDGTNKAAVEQNEVTLESGYWVVESMVMEGSEFSNEDMVGIFGPEENIFALAFDSAGKVNGVIFEEYFTEDYTGNLEKVEFAVDGEKVTGTGSGENLDITLQDGSVFIMKYQTEMPESIANNPWVTYNPNFDGAQTSAMSNFMSYGNYLIEDDVMYGLTHSQSNNGQFGATPFYMKGDFPEFEETIILDERGMADYIQKEGDYLYYIYNLEEVCRVKTDGSGFEVLYSGPCDYLQLHNGRLYFTNADFHYISIDLEGKDQTNEIDKEIYYPYFICEDWLVFQDDADDESLHLYNIKHGTELNITYVPSYCPVLDGHYLYYIDNATGEYYLNRIDMSNPEIFACEASENTLVDVVYMIDDVDIFACNNNRRPKEEWKRLATDHSAVTERELYVSEDYLIYHEYDEAGFITAKYLMSKERHGGSPFN